jgi:lipoprotein-releasing system permease protein
MDTDQLAEYGRDYGVIALAASVCVALLVYWLRRARDYKTFVAWRYLLNNPQRVSRGVLALWLGGVAIQLVFYVAIMLDLYDPLEPGVLQTLMLATALGTYAVWVGWVLRHSMLALTFYIFFMVCGCLAFVGLLLVSHDLIPFIHIELEQRAVVQNDFAIAVLASVALAGLAGFIGTIRAFFTFFTTVPIVGVFIGTGALVCVLSVMSGFESDLRQKILGSNAHIQVTREDGDFTEWRQVKARLDKIPGIVASTPYAVSEVVIAANNNGMNVIIKGIDPATVGRVTDLVSDLEDGSAMQHLQPLIDDPHDLRVLPAPPGAKPTNAIDPAPPDMPASGDPIDYSAPPEGSAGSGSGFVGDDNDGDIIGDHLPPHPVVDPAPPDLLTTDEPPIDYSGSGSTGWGSAFDTAVHVIDVPIETPSMSRRTQSLPGVLVGRELVKQTHLYTGEEVRVVSPLSDPSNPDATGSPIPFNRDYRVAGSFYTGMYEYDLKYVYVTLDSLQEFLDRGDAVDGIEIRVDDPDATDSYVAQINDQLGSSYRVQDWKELNRSLFSALKLEKIAMFLVLGIVILVASFSIVGNLIMVVVEKARQIALLKTLGASDVGIMQLFAIQGLLIGALGTGLGVGLGLLTCWAGQRFGIPLNPDVYYIDKMPVHVEIQSVLLTALAGVIISIAATFYPAFLAARVRPAAGMRH